MEASGEEGDDYDRKKSPAAELRKGVSQRIWVPAHAALSRADHDNLTIVICFSTSES